jgi:hypothetical protein
LGDIKNSLFFDTSNPKENKLIFPGANSIVLHSLSASFENEKIQNFISALAGSKGIICMAQSYNKRYLAWS